MSNSFGHRIVEYAIGTIMLICASVQPAQAQRSIEELKVRYVLSCEQARVLENLVSERKAKLNSALALFTVEVLTIDLTIGGTAEERQQWEAQIPQFDFLRNELQSTEIAAQRYRSTCIENKQAYLEALIEQIILAAVTEPESGPEPVVRQSIRQTQQTIRQTRRPPRPPRGPRGPYYDAQATGALISIIGGVIAGSRPPRGSGGSIGHGHRHNRPIP